MSRENAVLFGEHNRLVGIVTEPAATGTSADVGLLLWNAGLLHRVGPGRLNVDLARTVAVAGVTALRFDLSGLGDSGPRTDGLAGRDGAIADLRAAMDFLQQRFGLSRFVLAGLCSGADQAHRAALVDARVCGLVFLDGYAYRTPGFYMRRLAAFGSDWRRAARLVRRLVRRMTRPPSAPSSAGGAGLEEEFRWLPPPHAQAAADLQRFIDRGMHMLYVYSGEAFYYFNHAGQFARMYPGVNFQGRVRSSFFPAADHLFSQPGNRAQLITLIRDWVIAGVAAP